LTAEPRNRIRRIWRNNGNANNANVVEIVFMTIVETRERTYIVVALTMMVGLMMDLVGMADMVITMTWWTSW
jgi:hypothetical protein